MANVGIFDLTDTWNAGGTTFNAIKMSVTDTASAAGSKLLDLLVGGASKCSVDKAGNTTIAGTLGVTGAATLSSTLAVTGLGTFSAGIGQCAPVSSSVAIGAEARARGTVDVAVGFNAGGGGTADQDYTGISNTSIGAEAGFSLTSGNLNTFCGYRAGKDVTTGPRNTIVGAGPFNVTTGRGNVVVGNELNVDSATENWQLNIGQRYFHNRLELAPSNTTNSRPAGDCILLREAANELAMRNGTAAQTFDIYNTWTSATNFERAVFAWGSNIFSIRPQRGADGGSVREFKLAGGLGIGTDQTGGQLTIEGGQGTGTGAGGAIVFSTAPAGSSGSSANALAERLRITGAGAVEVAGGVNIALATTTGTKIGTATNQLLGFYNATPVDQPAVVADPTGGGTQDAEARTAINAIIDRLQELGLMATA